jgi:hypothetical protein
VLHQDDLCGKALASVRPIPSKGSVGALSISNVTLYMFVPL